MCLTLSCKSLHRIWFFLVLVELTSNALDGSVCMLCAIFSCLAFLKPLWKLHFFLSVVLENTFHFFNTLSMSRDDLGRGQDEFREL